MLTLAILIGTWTTPCVQTQVSGQQGFTKESYEIRSGGTYAFKRRWYTDAVCANAKGVDDESGTLVIGKDLSDDFMSKGATEIDFKSEAGVDRGAMKVEGGVLRVARGVRGSQTRNTMLSLTGYAR